jgi:UDP-glucuronate 4-epimerase
LESFKQLRLANQLTQAAVGRRAQRDKMPTQMGDVASDAGQYRCASAPVATGVRRFVEWYRDYYRR